MTQPTPGDVLIAASLIVSRERLRLAILSLRECIARTADELDPRRDFWRV